MQGIQWRRGLHPTSPVQSAVPALFSLYHISRTSRIYMDFPPPLFSVCFKRCLVWGCFFPATVLALSFGQWCICTQSFPAKSPNLMPPLPPPLLFQVHMCFQVQSKPPHLNIATSTSCLYLPQLKFKRLFVAGKYSMQSQNIHRFWWDRAVVPKLFHIKEP